MVNKNFIDILDDKWNWLVKDKSGEVSIHIKEPRETDVSDDPWGEFGYEWTSDGEWTFIEGFEQILDDIPSGKYKLR